MGKALRIPMRKGEQHVLVQMMKGSMTMDNMSLQLKLIAFTSVYRDDVMTPEEIEEFADGLGVSINPTREELVEAVKETGREVRYEQEEEATPE